MIIYKICKNILGGEFDYQKFLGCVSELTYKINNIVKEYKDEVESKYQIDVPLINF